MRSSKLAVLARVGLAAVLVTAVSACGSGIGEPSSTATKSVLDAKSASSAPTTPSAISTPTVSPTPTQSAAVLVTDDLSFRCDGLSTYDSLEDIWATWDGSGSASEQVDCAARIDENDLEGDLSAYTLTDVEQKIIDSQISEYDEWETEERGNEQKRDLLYFYGHCTQKDMHPYGSGNEGEDYVQETVQFVMELCPEHPNAEQVAEAAGVEAGKDAEREEGTRFEDGTYRVGEDIKPGTYVTTTLEDGCYWERTDANGNTIDNNFMNSALRAQVTIGSADYSFTSERCGEWVAQ